MASALFPCGHVNYPDFDHGERFMYCAVCMQWAKVIAKPVHTTEYITSPTNFTPPTSNE